MRRRPQWTARAIRRPCVDQGAQARRGQRGGPGCAASSLKRRSDRGGADDSAVRRVPRRTSPCRKSLVTGHHLPTGTLRSVLRYPHCGFSREQTMPTDACLYFYECTQCRHNAQRPGRSCCWSPRGCWCTLKRRLTPDRIERRVPGRPRPLTSVTASLPRHSPCAPAPHPACSIAARSSSASHLTQVAIRPRKTSFSPMIAARPHAASGRVGSALSQAK